VGIAGLDFNLDPEWGKGKKKVLLVMITTTVGVFSSFYEDG